MSTSGRSRTFSAASAANVPSGMSKDTDGDAAQQLLHRQHQTLSQSIPQRVATAQLPTTMGHAEAEQHTSVAAETPAATAAEIVFAEMQVLQPASQQAGPSSHAVQRGKAHPMRAGVRYFAATSLEPHQLALLHQAIAQLGKAR